MASALRRRGVVAVRRLVDEPVELVDGAADEQEREAGDAVGNSRDRDDEPEREFDDGAEHDDGEDRVEQRLHGRLTALGEEVVDIHTEGDGTDQIEDLEEPECGNEHSCDSFYFVCGWLKKTSILPRFHRDAPTHHLRRWGTKPLWGLLGLCLGGFCGYLKVGMEVTPETAKNGDPLARLYRSLLTELSVLICAMSLREVAPVTDLALADHFE